MKCPECGKAQKRKDGMVCNSCKYQFALDPKQPPNITDAAMRKTIDTLSAKGMYYFTFHQLFTQIYRLCRKKIRNIGCFYAAIISAFIAISSFAVFSDVLLLFRIVFGLFGIFIISTIVITNYRHLKVYQNYKSITKIIYDYHSQHPIQNMADGNHFRKQLIKKIDAEILSYSPERILIVEHDDVADMLILNRFHLENKVLVLSANKYPKHAFEAYQYFIQKNPDLLVEVLHDVSKTGHHLRGSLLADPSWHLNAKHVRDLGLSYTNVEKLREPMWIPNRADQPILNKGNVVENMRNGYRIPLDTAPPKAFSAGVIMAIATGMALLSEELLAEQQKQKGGDWDSSGGYG
jgi:hypothetical protein